MYLFQVMSSKPAIANSSHTIFMDLAGPEYGFYDNINYLWGVADGLGVACQQLYDVDLRKQATTLRARIHSQGTP